MSRLPAVLLVAALSLTGCAGKPKPVAEGIPGLQTFTEDPAQRHVTTRVTYDRTPPAGGQHWPAESGGVRGWLRCGVYTEPVPKEFAVHSQEHGAVWLTYLPGQDPAGLVALAKGNDYVIVSPFPEQPAPYMASTWGAQLSADQADSAGLAAFVRTYAGGGQGGEKGADCVNGSLPGPAEAALDKANR